jgi:prepilin-type N-terminal cleavage/methylation domain-containing protein
MKKRFRGFTVMELLVVVLLFSVASVAIASTFINYTRLHRRAANAETLGEEMRFVLELMVRAARNNTINYPSLPAGITNPSGRLNLISRAGARTSFGVFASTAPVCTGLNAACLAISLDGGATWSAMTGKNIQVDRFDVYVTPARNPFQPVSLGAYDNDRQPRVTFVIDARYLSSNPREIANISIQTSVGSRLYIR